MREEDWVFTDSGYDAGKFALNGNRFFCGNGYLGVRGTLQEYEKDFFPAVNLSGIFDQVGDAWREPLNAPNPFFTKVTADGEELSLPKFPERGHLQQLDFRHGLVRRKTIFLTKSGTVTVTAEHFAHRTKEHLLFLKFSVESDYPAKITVTTGIDGDVWDINGPHYDRLYKEQENGVLLMEGITHEKKDRVAVAEMVSFQDPAEAAFLEAPKKFLRELHFLAMPGKPVNLEKAAAVYTSKDCLDPGGKAAEALKREMEDFPQGFYEGERTQQERGWDALWERCKVEIKGDTRAKQALNYSLYHLLCIAPFHAKSLSIPARGLSGQTYKGAVFWDTEMFMLDFFLNCEPRAARTLLKYRIDTLPGALQKARQYGYEGAFYAWESQEGGYDACSDYNVTDVFSGRPMRTYFRDKQVHISAAVVFGLKKYLDRTGDESLLYEGGAKVIVECAKFYDSLLVCKARSLKYELWDVIGPDEYHERVNNNGYTNRMAKFVFDEAAAVLKASEKDENLRRSLPGYDSFSLQKRFAEDSERLYLPQPDREGIVEQFDGYFKLKDLSLEEVRGSLLNPREYWGGAYGVASETKIIKQADVVTWMALFPEDFSADVKWKNWEYYEPRTEHGSSLSACMYGILACACGHPEKAYPFFLKSAEEDLKGGGKEWAGDIYIGGTHPAAAGGAYMTAVFGFGGLSMKDGKISAHPRLPENWKSLRFRVCYQGNVYQVTESKEEAVIELIDGESGCASEKQEKYQTGMSEGESEGGTI